MCRVDFHTQLADKANQFNSDDVKQLLQAVYDIMAPEGEIYCQKNEDIARASPLLRRLFQALLWVIGAFHFAAAIIANIMHRV